MDRDDIRQIIHVDMDAFYASVEILDNPEYVGKPVIVGGDSKSRGVVCAASYAARKYGVHSAMPTVQAVRLCPNGVFLPVRMSRYAELSRQIRIIFERYTPQIEPISLDEAFLDVTGSIGLFPSAEEIGHGIKKSIKGELGLVASVGIAPNKFLAKLASDLKKPDGFMVITEENKQAILDPLPVRRIWGVGKVTEQVLVSSGIRTIAQLRKTPVESLEEIIGNQAEHLLRLAQGVDDSEVESFREAKSISSEETFGTDVDDKDILLKVLLNQVDEVSQRLREEGLAAKTITLKLRYGDFRTVTRSTTFDDPTNITKVLWEQAKNTFLIWKKKSAGPLRLLGFGASHLVREGSGQLQLFCDEEEQKQKKLDQTIDRIRSKFGDGAVKRGE